MIPSQDSSNSGDGRKLLEEVGTVGVELGDVLVEEGEGGRGEGGER